MGYAVPITVQMTDMTCGGCGIQFAVPEAWRAEKKETGKGWYCPNGCSRVYKESDVAAAKAELEAERDRHQRTLARLNAAETAEQKAKRELKRVNKRVSAGVCPCCNRTFQQLARHMKTKHPDHSA